MELGIKRVTRLIAQQFYNPSEFARGIDNSKVRVSHVTTSDWRCPANDGTSGVNPTIGATGNVDRIDPLRSKELCGLATPSAEGANDVHRNA